MARFNQTSCRQSRPAIVFAILILLSTADEGISAATGRYAPPENQRPDLTIQVDFRKPAGLLKPLHGVNGGPWAAGSHTADMISRHKEAGFPSVRLHDCNWPHPDVVDIPAIFPLFHLDPNDPANYLFAKTDVYLKPIITNGASLVYRLGVSIEHKTRFHTDPPPDFEKWSNICIHILRHYNDGWAKGFHYNIRHVEIWNEPNIGHRMWTGSEDQYFKLYRTAVTAIKKYNPNMMVGGPVTSIPDGRMAGRFLAYCRDNQLPLDFFSWHCYTDSLPVLLERIKKARNILDEYGFQKTASWCTEWRPMLAGFRQVTWKQGMPRHTVRDAFARNRNHEAAAFTASALLQMQDAPVDMAYFYTADDSPWSMFDEYGEPGRVFFAMKAFHRFLQTPNRVAVTGAPGKNEITVGAGLSKAGEKAMLLASNFRSNKQHLRIDLQHLPWKSKIKVTSWRLDESHEFTPEQDKEMDPENPVLFLRLPSSTVLLVQLQPISEP